MKQLLVEQRKYTSSHTHICNVNLLLTVLWVYNENTNKKWQKNLFGHSSTLYMKLFSEELPL